MPPLENLWERRSPEELKAMKCELEHLGKGELLKVVEEKFGETYAGLVASLGIDDIVRDILKDQIDARLKEMGEDGN